MNIVKTLTSALGWVADALKGLFTKAQFKKAKEVAKVIGSLLPYAIPAVKLVAALTPNRTDDEIVALIERFAIPTSLDTTKPLTDLDKENVLFAAASAAFQGNLEEAIRNAGAAGLILAGQVVKSKTDISDKFVDSAVQDAYTFLSEATAVPAAA